MPLILEFSRLSCEQQKSFMELLNAYLYASPQRRREQRRMWMERLRLRDGAVERYGE